MYIHITQMLFLPGHVEYIKSWPIKEKFYSCQTIMHYLGNSKEYAVIYNFSVWFHDSQN